MRKSLIRRLSRLSNQSQQSYISGVLDPDSNVGIENEGEPLWFKDLDDNSTSTQRSLCFSLVQNDSPILDTNSEPSLTPQQRTWWKDLDESPEPQGIRSEAVRERSNVSERSPSVELSDASSAELGIAKQKSTLRRKKRKSLSRAMFSLISESSKGSIGSEKLRSDTAGQTKQVSNSSSSFSSVNESVSKVRKMPFKTKRMITTKKLANTEERSQASVSDVFQHALNDFEWADDGQDVGKIPNSPRNPLGSQRGSRAGSMNSVDTFRLERENTPSKRQQMNLPDNSEDTAPIEDEHDHAESLKLSVKLRSKKKRMIFAQTYKRKSPDFENLLNEDESKDESDNQGRVDDQEEDQSNRNETGHEPSREFSPEIAVENTVVEDESGEADSVRKQRAGLFRKRRKILSEETAGQVSEFRDASSESENEEIPQPRQKTATPDVRERSTNTKVDRVSASQPSNTEAAVKDTQPNLRRSLAQHIATEERGSQRLSAIEKSYRANSSGSASDEPEEHRTTRLQIRRSIVKSADKKRGSVQEQHSSSQLSLGKRVSHPQTKSVTPEHSNRSMREGSPTKQKEGETGNGEEPISTHGVTDRQYPNGSNSGPKGVSVADIHVDSTPLQVGLGVSASFAEKISEMRATLEEVKKKELALMKSGKIDSYFKSIPKTKTTVPVQLSQKSQDKVGSPGKNKNQKPPARSNKAYLVNGQIYKRPRLPRPKSWATDRLYNYLWKKMEPKYKLKTRVRSEKFIVNLSETVSLVTRRTKYENYKDELEDLMRKMARLEIIKTRNDFHIFCQQFLPYDFRIKVIPMILPGSVRNIPFEPGKLFQPILEP